MKYMGLTNTLKALGFVGLMALAGCNTSPKSIPFNDKYGKWLFLRPVDNYLIAGYDTTGDDREDLRLIYRIVSQDKDTLYLRLEEIGKDKNNNGIFEEDEFQKVPSSKTKEIEQDSVNVSI